MKRANFKDLDRSELDKNQLIEFAKNPQGFLLISGSNGSGKTYAALAIYYSVSPVYTLPDSYDTDLAIFISQAELNLEWNCSENKYHLAQKYVNTKLLVLDDLGTRKPTDAFLDFLYLIIDNRYTKKETHATVITTNLTGEAFEKMFGTTIISRAASGITKRWENNDRRFEEKYKIKIPETKSIAI